MASYSSATLFILAFHLTQAKNSNAAFILINQVKSIDKPKHFITDKLPYYNKVVKTILNEILIFLYYLFLVIPILT